MLRAAERGRAGGRAAESCAAAAGSGAADCVAQPRRAGSESQGRGRRREQPQASVLALGSLLFGCRSTGFRFPSPCIEGDVNLSRLLRLLSLSVGAFELLPLMCWG